MITADITPKDAIAAIRIKRRRMFTGKSGLLVWGGIAIGILVGALNVFAGPHYGIPPDFGYWILGFYAVAWTLMTVNDFLFLPLLLRYLYRKMSPEKHRLSMGWDEQGITVMNTKGRVLTPWTDFVEWYQNDTVLMLFRRNGRYVVFPRRALDQASLADFQHHLEAKIGHEGKIAWADQPWLVP